MCHLMWMYTKETLGMKRNNEEITMQVIGLSGGTGTGKSLVCEYLIAHGAYIIDTDKIGHDIILKGEPAYGEIVAYYGDGILDEEGNIVRKRLGAIVFSDKKKLEFLNHCTHKYILEEIKRLIQNEKEKGIAKYVVIDAPVLFEAGADKVCDTIWIVTADLPVRIQRIMKRDGIDYDMALARISNQKSPEEYAKLADVLIKNNGNKEDLQYQLDALLK